MIAMRKYGYCRISRKTQNIERQVRNIKRAYPDAIIIKEIYTGRRYQGRKEFEKLIQHVVSGDVIIFDSVSRMSRNAKEGFEIYQELYQKGVTLVFLKEPHINTEVYKKAMENSVALTGSNVDYILEGINRYLLELSKEQIYIAFAQAEKEVEDLRQRTREGIETARMNGKQIGQPKGTKYHTKKFEEAKEIILKHNKSFGGTLTDEETWNLAKISKKTFYKYKKKIKHIIS